jgi:Mg-chelatase subunit ChlD
MEDTDMRYPASHQHERGRQHPSVYQADRVGLVGFNDTGFVIAKPTEAHASWLQERTRALHTKVAGNYTNMTAGLRTAIDLLKNSPRGFYRRLWLLSDGYPNKETWSLMSVVSQAREAYVNIMTIGFGDPTNYDENLLRRISDATHRGAFLPVQSLRQLTDALIASDTGTNRKHHHSRAETTILCIDLSGSMLGSMEGRRKIDVVEQSILSLLLYKQRCFS